MTRRVFIISDTHFGHKKIIEFEPQHRPFSTIEEHDAELVRRWNNIVKKNDTVWHLGDVLFGSEAFDTLAQLNGVKRLIMGNHDVYPVAKYLEHFNSIHSVVEIKGCVLSHMPVHPSQFERFRANIHGHLHAKCLDDARYICVSAEQIELTPVLLDDILCKAPPSSKYFGT